MLSSHPAEGVSTLSAPVFVACCMVTQPSGSGAPPAAAPDCEWFRSADDS